MQRNLWKIALTALAGAAVFSGASAPAAVPDRYAISLEQVTSAVLLAHPELAGDAIELAAPVEARERAPRLIAGSIEHAGGSGAAPGSVPAPARLQMHCSSREVCLPFYVVVHLTGREAAAGPTPAAAANSAGEPRGAEAAVTSATVSATHTEQRPLLRSGETVLLVIDSGKLHLRLPAICLQSGSPGSMIRVRSAAARGPVFQAEVLDRRTVRGSL